jgi:hypothetical protein
MVIGPNHADASDVMVDSHSTRLRLVLLVFRALRAPGGIQ